MKTILFLMPLSILVGCATPPSPQAKAASHASPLLAALKEYHRKTGDYPQRLDELRPDYIGANVVFGDHRDAARSWTLIYQRGNRNHYELYLDCTPCSQAVYLDGELMAGYGPVFSAGQEADRSTQTGLHSLCGRWQSHDGDTYEFGSDGTYARWLQTPPISKSAQAEDADTASREGLKEGRFSVDGNLLIVTQTGGASSTNKFFTKKDSSGNDMGKFFGPGYSLRTVSSEGVISRYELMYR